MEIQPPAGGNGNHPVHQALERVFAPDTGIGTRLNATRRYSRIFCTSLCFRLFEPRQHVVPWEEIHAAFESLRHVDAKPAKARSMIGAPGYGVKMLVQNSAPG